MYDSGVYFTTGANIAENGCVSASLPDSGACVPSWGGNHFPGYPLFIGAVFSLFPRSVAAILIAQSVLTGVALFWLVTGAAHFTGSRRTSLIAGYVVGLSPATLPWSRMLLLECLLAACGIWLLGSLLRILAGRRTRLFAFVIPVAAATFLRPDSILLAIPVAIVFFARYTPRIAVAKLALIGLCVSAPIFGWWVRSVRLGLPTLPVLAVPEGFRQPLGSFALLKTWMTHDDQLREWHWPMLTGRYNDVTLANSGLESDPAAHARVVELLNELRPHSGTEVPEHIDRAFGEVADERRSRSRLRTMVILPVIRAWSVWTDTTPVSGTGWPVGGFGGVLASVATAWRIIFGVLTGAGLLVVWRRRERSGTLVFGVACAGYLLLRTVFLAVAGFPEPRYVVSMLPFAELFTVVSFARLANLQEHPFRREP
jgi:hypothetical protein